MNKRIIWSVVGLALVVAMLEIAATGSLSRGAIAGLATIGVCAFLGVAYSIPRL